MEPFKTHTGIIATLDRSNVDTDAIIPKQFLKSIKRTGYGPSAFFDWRYAADGQPNAEFELNQPRFEGRSILVTRNNFGCGSSREHAVWALAQDGYKVVIAPVKSLGDKHIPAFADIFRTNATKNGLLTIELSEEEVEEIFVQVKKQKGLKARADLDAQTLTLLSTPEKVYGFEMEKSAKEQLLKGLDDIALSLTYATDITKFEANHETWL